MLSCPIPGYRDYQFEYLVLDLNGTLSIDGVLLDGVSERLTELSQQLEIYMVTADTQGTAATIATKLGIHLYKLSAELGTPQKALFVEQLGAEHVVAMGNGANDMAMFERAALGIAIVGTEGLAVQALAQADIVVTNPCDGLDLLIHPKRLIATLRR